MFVLFFVFILLIVGVQLWSGKWLFLIAGYNLMNDEEKGELNPRFLGKVTGLIALLSAFILIGMMILPQLKWVWFTLQVLVLGVGLIFLNTSPKRFKKEN